jgi:hypothetical protein
LNEQSVRKNSYIFNSSNQPTNYRVYSDVKELSVEQTVCTYPDSSNSTNQPTNHCVFPAINELSDYLKKHSNEQAKPCDQTNTNQSRDKSTDCPSVLNIHVYNSKTNEQHIPFDNVERETTHCNADCEMDSNLCNLQNNLQVHKTCNTIQPTN